MSNAYFEFSCPVRILSGRAALANLPYELRQLGAKKPMIVTDQGIVKAGLLQRLLEVFVGEDIQPCAVFDQTPPDSSDKVVDEAAALYLKSGCDALVALGGGSVLDTAKGINIVVSEETDDLLELQGVDRVQGPMEPFIAIPTTAGTGSEVTCVAVISNVDAGVKMAFVSNRLYPDVAILDPVMTQTVPSKITAATGMDALTHAIEAVICLQKNPVSDSFAFSAIRLIRDHLVDAVTRGDNPETRIAMANAALLAGIAFSNSMVGNIHAMAHACGGVAHVPHGVANAILLPIGMENNLAKAVDRIAQLCEPMGLACEGRDQSARAADAIAWVRDMQKTLHEACGLPYKLSDAGVSAEQLEPIARLAMDDGAVTYNPEEFTFEDALALLKKAF